MALRVIIYAAIDRALKLRQQSIFDVDEVFQSSFFTAYLCGYPKYLDDMDPNLGAAVRHALLVMFFPDAECQARFDWFQNALLDGDPSIKVTLALAAGDGEEYFTRLLRSEPADDLATRNLELQLRTLSEL